MKHIKLICETTTLKFESEANKVIAEGYEPIGSIAVNYTDDEGWSFIQPFGKLGINDEYQRKMNDEI